MGEIMLKYVNLQIILSSNVFNLIYVTLTQVIFNGIMAFIYFFYFSFSSFNHLLSCG